MPVWYDLPEETEKEPEAAIPSRPQPNISRGQPREKILLSVHNDGTPLIAEVVSICPCCHIDEVEEGMSRCNDCYQTCPRCGGCDFCMLCNCEE